MLNPHETTCFTFQNRGPVAPTKLEVIRHTNSKTVSAWLTIDLLISLAPWSPDMEKKIGRHILGYV